MEARDPGEASSSASEDSSAPETSGGSVWAPEWTPPDLMAAMPQTVWQADAGHDPSRSNRPFPVSPVFVRLLFLVAGAAAFALIAWQTVRVIDGTPWSGSLALAALAVSVVAAVALLAWTWIVVENARRLLSVSLSQDPPSPMAAVISWVAPLLIAGAAGGALALLQAELSDVGGSEASPLPLAVAIGALFVTLLMCYRPLHVLAGVTRRVGGRTIELARWFWVPAALLMTGAASLWAFDAAGLYGEDFDGFVPAWALGVVAIPPAVLVLALAARGGAAVEEAAASAFDRRNGDVAAGVGRGRVGVMARALRADARPPIPRDVGRRIRLVPGAELMRLAVVTTIAALALLSIVGAVVMFLFWREAGDGVLLRSQQERAWDALAALQRVERLLALGLLGIVSLWSFVNVMNARLATGRRRNPILAAAAWPAAAYGIWWIADRTADEDRVGAIVAGFALQALVLFIPFFLLERSAVTVSARRQPIRAAYALALILLVHTQGLAGLSTVDDGAGTDQFGRIAGYLALAALVQLISTLTITEASQVIDDGARNEADRHDFLADQRRAVDGRKDEVAAREAEQAPTAPEAATDAPGDSPPSDEVAGFGEVAAFDPPGASPGPATPAAEPAVIAASNPPPSNW